MADNKLSLPELLVVFFLAILIAFLLGDNRNRIEVLEAHHPAEVTP